MESKIREWVDQKFDYLKTLSDEDLELEIIRYWGYAWYKDYALEYYHQKEHQENQRYHLFDGNLFSR
ncbi:MAG: hypothetical protein IIZ33_01725 [Erysipelotrichaceae bacterium]|nr:hypothetical protein [Erysipelotrichaceae bacterium]